MKTIVVVVQARVLSSRFNAKICKPLGDGTVLEYQLKRLKAAKLPTHIVVAAPSGNPDTVLEPLCENVEVPFFRGHPTDLIDRHLKCARAYNADVVVKIPSDVPLIDPKLVDEIIQTFLDSEADYVSNLHPESFPDGFDVEVFSMSALEKAYNEAEQDFEREHTTPFFWDNNPEFTCKNVAISSGESVARSIRVVLDYPEDLDLISAVHKALYPQNPLFSYQEIINYLKNHPEVNALNEKYRGVNWYRHHLDELKSVTPEMTRPDHE